MINRRRLLLGLGGTAALVTGILGIRFVRATDAAAIEMVISKRLNYLKLDTLGLRKFAADMAARKQVSSARLRVVPALGKLYEHFPDTHNFILDAVHNGEERIVSLFLLSTDFFINGKDETRVVNYLGIYDPLRPCGNPFARSVAIGD